MFEARSVPPPRRREMNEGDQTNNVRKAMSERPTISIDQSPVSRPSSRRSVLIPVYMFASHLHGQDDSANLAGKSQSDCCAPATPTAKRFEARLRHAIFDGRIRQLRGQFRSHGDR